MKEAKFSDEFLNAFVDDQLSPEDKARAYPDIHQDPELNRRVCELRKLRDLVQLAYKEPPQPVVAARTSTRGRMRVHRGNIAAGVLLLVGVALGWGLRATYLHDHGGTTAQSLPSAPRAEAPAGHSTAQAAAAADAAIASKESGHREVKIALHLNRGHLDNMREVLDEAENVLKLYRDRGQAARVEIITNGDGLNLLRADKSPFADRIRRMQQDYSNLVFAACQNTIDRLKREQGIHAQLVPEAIVIDSGVAQIILLQQQGWAYIQV